MIINRPFFSTSFQHELKNGALSRNLWINLSVRDVPSVTDSTTVGGMLTSSQGVLRDSRAFVKFKILEQTNNKIITKRVHTVHVRTRTTYLASEDSHLLFKHKPVESLVSLKHKA